MAELILKNVSKKFQGSPEVVSNFNLMVEAQEFIVIVGPSGCGKSTTLRMIAGLETVTGGEIYIGGRLVNDIPPKDRDIAMVFQNFALYPHMTVYQNMAFGLKMRKLPRNFINEKVAGAAEMLGISHLLNRKPGELSGGECQRAALGRAMVRDPAVFLLDEPLSNLDAQLRTTMRAEIARLHKKLGTVFFYVTHDQIEAMSMADRIVVMKDGVIQQVGTPQEVYSHPCNLFVAGFIGAPQMNFIKVVISTANGRLFAETAGIKFPVPQDQPQSSQLREYIGKHAIMGIRAEHISDHPSALALPEIVTAKLAVDLVERMGADSFIYARLGSHNLIARALPGTRTVAGSRVNFAFDLSNAHFFDPETERSIGN